MKSKIVLLIALFPVFSFLKVSGSVNYSLSFPEPQTHYVSVTMEIDGWNGSPMMVKMPVWAPGSYLVREFSRHVESVEAKDEKGNMLTVSKAKKNAWQISSKGVKKVIVTYKVYAYELSVRTSFIDAEHAYLNGTSIFMYVDALAHSPLTVTVHPYPSWKVVSVALDAVSADKPRTYAAANYDALVDAPFEIGNQVVFGFTSSGVPHEVAMFGDGNYDIEKLKVDFKKITEAAAAVFGEHPCKKYLFIVHNLEAGGGGLEHMNSTTLETNRWCYGNEGSYTGFLSLVAHEYFHLWNVKRLRPYPLGPFDYENENYTSLLWVAEGFTAYYDDLIVRRCGFSSVSDYLKTLAGGMSYCMNIKGAAYQTLAESSLEAWIKYYRPTENSANSAVSYYTKGSVVGALLDMEIRKTTNGAKSLNDVMREMYLLYFKKLNRAYTYQEFVSMVNKVAGKNMDAFFENYVNGTAPLPLADFVNAAGLELIDLNANDKSAWTGIATTFSNGRLTVTRVERNSPAWVAGINVNDEIIAIDQYRTGEDINGAMALKEIGDEVKFTVVRNSKLQTIALTCARTPAVKYYLTQSAAPSEAQKKIFDGWIN